MINRTTLILNNLIFILFFTILSAQPTYEFEIMSIPDLETPLGMNSDGEKIVGTNFSGMAVYWSDSTGSLFLGPGEAWGISENDRIFAELENSDGNWEAALVENEEITFLGNIEGGNTCDAFYSHGLGMSSDGSTGVGMGWINCGTSAFYWTDEDGIVELGQYEGNSTKAQAVSGDGQVIGGWAQTSNRASCLWDRDGNITLLGSLQVGNDYGEVHVISQDGTQVGGYCAGSTGNNVEGYIWTAEEGMTGLGVPANSAATNVSRVFDLSENNVAVGEYLNETPVFYKACIYTEETGEFVNLRDYLLNLGMEEIEGWDLHRALCVSDDGNTIAGYGKDPSNNWTGWRIRIIVGEDPGEMLLVPSEYATIQDAINASEDGDTVLVAPGTYVENINYSGKNIVIGSYFLTYGMDYFIEQTIIDGNQDGSVVTFNNGEDSTAVLDGFTITGGLSEYGGGIRIDSVSSTLKNLVVIGNTANSYGGGIHVAGSGWTSMANPRLENLIITGNSANSGGGISCWIYSSPSLENVTISGNTAGSYGGGILSWESNPSLENVTISGNTAGSSGGGGIYSYSSGISLGNVNISDNSTSGPGGGIYYNQSNSILTNVTISGNSATGEDGFGGAIYLTTVSYLTLLNCILWNNSPQEIYFSGEIEWNSGSTTAAYCDIQDGEDGIITNDNGIVTWEEGNINTNPLFCNPDSGDFTLADNSPCVDSGEYNANMDASDVGCEAILSTDKDVLPLQFVLYQNYPNPFNPVTTLRYDLPEDAMVNLTIYDMMGRQVSTLVSSEQSAGYKSVQWNAANDAGAPVSAGLYLYRIRTGKFVKTHKMVLLK